MGVFGQFFSTVTRRGAAFGAFAALGAALVPFGVSAQTVPTAPGVFVEIEGQAAFGGSSFDAGLVPSFDSLSMRMGQLDDGHGWGGALAIGYVWQNGWHAALRVRRLRTDDAAGRYDPGIIPFFAYSEPGDDPDGIPVPLLDARAKVDAETSIVDFEVGREVSFDGGFLRLFGALTYAEITRDVSIIDDCGCLPLVFRLASDFEGLGPKIGFRGGVPLNATTRFIGGASAAVLFGSSRFANSVGSPPDMLGGLTDKESRTIAFLEAQAGLAFALGAGSLTLGYRIDAFVGALDTDQRVSPVFIDLGLPSIGDRRDDFVQHGPFARLTWPFAGSGE